MIVMSGVNSHCPRCEIDVPRVPHPKELMELAEEVRHRMIKAEKTSYWRQFEHGMLGRDAVLVLINLADSVMDTPERRGREGGRERGREGGDGKFTVYICTVPR